MNRRPIVLFLCSVIGGAIGVLGWSSFVPIKDGNPTPPWQEMWFSASVALLALSVIGAVASVIWLLVGSGSKIDETKSGP
jgi:hypothetical protein